MERRPPVRGSYLAAAEIALALLQSAELEERWEQESALRGWPCGLLAGHLARSILQVEWFLDGAQPPHATIDAVSYYAALTGSTDPKSDLNEGVRARSQETANLGRAAMAAATEHALRALQERIPAEPAARTLESFGRPMLLDEYLVTRIVELSIHVDDLALSLALPRRVPPAALDIATATLFDAARKRHDSLDVLRALTRTERDPQNVLRVF